MCGSPLTIGGTFCPRCGIRISPAISSPVSPPVQAPVYQPTLYPPSPPKKKSHTGLIVGLILLVLVIVATAAVGGSYAYADAATASLAPTCISSSVTGNWIGLTISVLTYTFSPSTVLGEIQIELGIQNPSSLTVDSNWILQATMGGALMSDHEVFTVPTGSTQLVVFHLSITATTAIRILGSAVSSAISGRSIPVSMSLTRDDSALGFHFTHQFTSTTSVSQAPTTSLASASNSTSTLPSC
jgi:hypothetical protein